MKAALAFVLLVSIIGVILLTALIQSVFSEPKLTSAEVSSLEIDWEHIMGYPCTLRADDGTRIWSPIRGYMRYASTDSNSGGAWPKLARFYRCEYTDMPEMSSKPNIDHGSEAQLSNALSTLMDLTSSQRLKRDIFPEHQASQLITSDPDIYQAIIECDGEPEEWTLSDRRHVHNIPLRRIDGTHITRMLQLSRLIDWGVRFSIREQNINMLLDCLASGYALASYAREIPFDVAMLASAKIERSLLESVNETLEKEGSHWLTPDDAQLIYKEIAMGTNLEHKWEFHSLFLRDDLLMLSTANGGLPSSPGRISDIRDIVASPTGDYRDWITRLQGIVYYFDRYIETRSNTLTTGKHKSSEKNYKYVLFNRFPQYYQELINEHVKVYSQTITKLHIARLMTNIVLSKLRKILSTSPNMNDELYNFEYDVWHY